MLPWLLVGGVVIAAVRRGLALRSGGASTAQASKAARSIAVAADRKDAPLGTSHPANAQVDAQYRDAVHKLGIADGAPPPEALPLPLRQQIVSASKPGHSADTTALADQIRNSVQTRQLSPEAEQWISDHLARLVGGALNVIPLVGPLAKAGWGAAYANRSPDGSEPTVAAAPPPPPPTPAQIERSRHSAAFFSHSGVPHMELNPDTHQFELVN